MKLALAYRRLRRYLSHPLNRGRVTGTLWRWLRWQVVKRLARGPRLTVLDGELQINCYPDSSVAATIQYMRLPDYDESQFLMRYLSGGDVFLDVGANIGIYTLLAARAVGQNGRVIAFEPQQIAASRLCENLSLNGLRNVVVDTRCIADRVGSIPFDHAGDATGGITQPRDGASEVPCTTLDACLEEFGLDHIAMAKVDVEGAELLVLHGARRILSEKLCSAWLLECNDLSYRFGYARREMLELLREAGYEIGVYRADDERFIPLPRDGRQPSNVLALDGSVVSRVNAVATR